MEGVSQDPSTLKDLNLMTPGAVQSHVAGPRKNQMSSFTSGKGRILLRQNATRKHLLSNNRKKLLPIMDVSDVEEQLSGSGQAL